MLPPSVAAIDPRFQTPARMTIITGLIVAVLAFVVPLDALLELVNIGTFSAFIIVCAGVIWLRYSGPICRARSARRSCRSFHSAGSCSHSFYRPWVWGRSRGCASSCGSPSVS